MIEQKIFKTTNDYLNFSINNNINSRETAEEYLKNNRNIPFIIRKCSRSQYYDNCFAISYIKDNKIIHRLIRTDLNEYGFYLFNINNIKYIELNYDALIWLIHITYYVDIENTEYLLSM